MRKLIPFLLFCIILSAAALADVGPKPTVDIDVTYNGQPIEGQFNAKMLHCTDKDDRYWQDDLIPQFNISEYDEKRDCYWKPSPLAWGGACMAGHCDFGYMPPDEFRLAVYIPEEDFVFISNQVERKSFNSEFSVDIQAQEAFIEDTTKVFTEPPEMFIEDTTPLLKRDKIGMFVKALIITLVLELFTAWIFLSATRTRRKKRILFYVGLASMITLPIVWFGFSFIANILLCIILAEAFAFIFEAYFIHWTNKRTIKLRKAFILSIIMNSVSLLIGGFIFIVLELFI